MQQNINSLFSFRLRVACYKHTFKDFSFLKPKNDRFFTCKRVTHKGLLQGHATQQNIETILQSCV